MSDLTSEVLQYFPQIRETAEGFQANCPRCADSEKKFYYNTTKEVGCCFHSDCPWSKDRKGVTKMRLMAFFSKNGINAAPPDVIKSSPDADLSLPEEFKLIQELGSPILRDSIYEYLESRGLRKKLVRAARIGYCDTGKFWGYLIFPVFDDEGAVGYWQARRFKDRKPKFRNPASSKKTELVYRIGTAKRPRRITLVESIINTLTLETGNNESQDLVIGLLGKTMSDTQLEHVLLYDKWLKEIVIALDPDAKREAVEIAMQLQGRGKIIRIAEFPEDQDVNSMGREASWDIVRKAVVFDKNRRMEFLHGS